MGPTAVRTRSTNTRRAAAWLLCAVVPVLAAGCAGGETGDDATPRNVVLIVLDTLRSDHLGCYGYERNTSPNIDAFAATATRYTRSISSASWTVPSHASLFTGKPPFEHGAHTFQVDTPSKNVNPLGLDQLTLAELLQAEGYATGAFVANAGYLARHWQLDQGFETYHVERLHAEQLNEHVFSWLDEVRPPFLLFVNYIDTHRPYNARPREGFLDPPAEQGPELLDRLVKEVLPADKPVPLDLAGQVIDQYDTSIANVDEQIGIFLDRLRARGLEDDTIVVLTSDHGEYFGEHHLVEHSKDIYQPVLEVPLLIRGDEGKGRTVDTPVVSNDVPRLILDLLPERIREPATTLFPDAPGNHLVVAENYYTRRKDLFHAEWGWRFRRIRRAVFDWPLKYIDSTDGAHELYDLEQDPREQRNLIDDRPEEAARLRTALAELEASRQRPAADPDTEPLDEELRERLKALGYVGD